MGASQMLGGRKSNKTYNLHIQTTPAASNNYMIWSNSRVGARQMWLLFTCMSAASASMPASSSVGGVPVNPHLEG